MRQVCAGPGICGLVIISVFGIVGPGCAETKSTSAESAPVARPAETVRPVVQTSGDVKGQSTVTPDCPKEAKRGELTTIRSAHTWTVDNPTAESRQYVVVLEIADDLGHSKKKEVPGEVKAHSKIEDSTSIALVTTYREPGAIQIQAKTTVRMGEQTLTTRADTCRFELP